MIDRNIIISCIRAYNGEYSIQGFAKVLTGYKGFRFIPKLKRSKYYGILKNENIDEVMSTLTSLLNEGIITERDNYKIFIID